MDGFYTLKGYELNEGNELTHAMEDYLEMITRIAGADGTRVNELSKMLHVRPSSVTKMVQQLAETGFVGAEKYGEIVLTEKGRAVGEYLLYRHKTVHEFLCSLNGTENELEQAEKIEHFLTKTTVDNLAAITKTMKPPKKQNFP